MSPKDVAGPANGRTSSSTVPSDAASRLGWVVEGLPRQRGLERDGHVDNAAIGWAHCRAVWGGSQKAQGAGVVSKARCDDGREPMLAGPLKSRLEELAPDAMTLKLIANGYTKLQRRVTRLSEAQVANDPLLVRHFGKSNEAFVVHMIERAEGTGEPGADAARIAEEARMEAVG